MDDPELARLAGNLPRTVLKARADSTTRKYLGAYRRWKEWVEGQHAQISFPVSTPMFALYLQHVGESTGSRSAVSEAINAVSWVQRLAGMEPVGQNHLIRSINEGFQRTLAAPKRKKEPVTPEMLREIVASMGRSPTLSDVRLASICLLAYAAFLRIDELGKLRCCDIDFNQERLEVTITASKTDQYRDGRVVPIARTGNATCPVAMLQRYVTMGEIDTSSELKLYRGVCVAKGKERLRATGGLSYTRMRELVLEKFSKLGYDKSQFGLHSFRAGGATMAANSPGLPERLFKRHGRWLSEKAKDGYVKDSLHSRLKVSKSLGL